MTIVQASDAPGDEALIAAGLLRESLRLSARLDVAAGIEDCDAPTQIAAHVDADSATLTTTLIMEGRAPAALAATPFERGRVAEAWQTLALATRRALGDHAESSGTGLRLLYSESAACVLATERALAAAAEADLPGARGHLAEARRADAGCTVALLAVAELELRANDFGRAERVAQEALQLESRCSPSTRHRLARVLLLARAAAGGDARTHDQDLLALGDAMQRERPHDPHGAWTRAQALSLLGRFAEAEAILATLRARWPRVAQVPYHHGLALLGCDRATDALAALAAAEPRLPPLQTVIPRAIALWSAQRGPELTRYLADLVARDDVQGSSLLHHVRRMQASHAILEDRGDDAATLLLTDLEWLRQRPSRLGQYAEHLASTGQVLVLLGRAADLTRAVDAFLLLPHLDEGARRALTFVGGLAAVARTRTPATIAEASLSKEGASAWSHMLRAAAHRMQGELADETRALLQATQLDKSALLRAALARVLRTAGDAERAQQVLSALRADLLRFDLRRLAAHPLADPAHGLALLATQP